VPCSQLTEVPMWIRSISRISQDAGEWTDDEFLKPSAFIEA
jgi:hypothetical protein